MEGTWGCLFLSILFLNSDILMFQTINHSNLFIPASNGFNLHLRLVSSILLEAFDKIFNYHLLHCSPTSVVLKGSSSEDKLQIFPDEQMSEAVYDEWHFGGCRLFPQQSLRMVQYLFCCECHLVIA